MTSASSRPRITPRHLVLAWMFGFAGSLVIQSVFQHWFAANAFWGANHGWQNEIAIWNLGMIGVLAGVLRARSGIERYVLPGLAVLSLCFGINHAVALAAAPGSLSHIAGATMNFLAVGLFGVWFATGRTESEA